MPIQACCCTRTCTRPSYFFITPTGLIICCGFTTLAPILGVTFGVHPQAINLFPQVVLNRTGYDGSSNCDPLTVIGTAFFHAEMFVDATALPATKLLSMFLRSDTFTDPYLSDITYDVSTPTYPDDGNLFRYDQSDGVPQLSLGSGVDVPNNHPGSPNCNFPDPFQNNFPVDSGNVHIEGVCTNVTLSSSSGSDGGAVYNASSTLVSAAAGSLTINFTAVGPSGAPGDWYIGKGLTAGTNPYAVHGTGTAADDITFTSATTGSGSSSITLNYAANTSGFTRELLIFINDKTYSLAQDG